MKRGFTIFIVLLAIMACSLIANCQSNPQEEILIGAIYPMTGGNAQSGHLAKLAMETAIDVINNSYDYNLPLARTEGLPNLNGAKVRIILADHQGLPEMGISAVEKLITQDHVVAVLGCFHSSVAAVVSMQCERYGIPFLAPESSSPSLHRRGLKWFFRTSPHDESFSYAMFEFMDDLKNKNNLKIENIALIHEDTLFGTDSANAQTKFAAEFGYNIVGNIQYRANSTSMVSEVLKLKSFNADAVLGVSYTSDAILILKTMEELKYTPKIFIGQDAGWTSPELVRELGKEMVEGIVSRNVFSLDLAKERPMVLAINEKYRKISNMDLTDNTSREFMATIILADAINRAGSTNPDAIRKALQNTNTPTEELILPWEGVRFDESGQNILATPIMTQWQDGEMRTVWPFNVKAAEFIYPIPR